jgi:hypothetical protein
MRVKIGKHVYWWGPYQIAEKILFWIPKYHGDLLEYTPAYNKYVHGLGEWLASTWVNDICQWIHSKRQRTIKVHIDNYDVWNADHTLALVILPTLKKLKEQKQGAPSVDDEDVPWYLRSHLYTKENDYDTDPAWFKRYEWVLGEMIWAFEQLVNDDWDSVYHHGNIDFYFEPCKDNEKLSEMKHGPKHTHWFDDEGYDKHSKCIDNGLRLFGKYYRGLWS